ncbi:hypothetical protein EG359_10435 [Chryseobacterium joostei]|uniref:Lipoprotein n=1 Tax=Chryseobacterium joostei TaxID=112234 RepID=A0A1N7IFX8_9FLAO|nr:hypothetical protein [Chryseobacterium joostei]AZB00015.1 hypothetical protein EG359_10435 [Chryseobacterium joostei]SIS35985.1 hypothetical protein SAMN05421768_1054 [Chryseobacterium joostei]
MKRIFFLILFSLTLISCSEKKQNVYKVTLVNFNIGIVLKKNHLYLKEYKRYLTIFSKKNEELESIKLMEDNGTGANSYLYQDKNNYIIIDCDGSWYSIDKKKGNISLIGNFWLKEPPKNYLGTFMLTSDSNKINFVKQEEVKLSDIYKYGGG